MEDRLKRLFDLYDSIVEKKEPKMTLIKSTGKTQADSFDLKALNRHIVRT